MSGERMPPFDLAETPVEAGVTLLEASAGTGKTYTLAGLYLRCVAELGLGVETILAVTFTRAATAELRARIRARLRGALAEVAGGEIADPLVAGLVARCGGAVEERLRAAVARFDEAQIFTIHGFCQRALAEMGFEAGMAFDREVVADDAGLLRELARDYWRRRFAARGAEELVVAAAEANGLDAGRWEKLAKQFSAHPDLLLLPEEEGGVAAHARALQTVWEEVVAGVRRESDVLIELLVKRNALSVDKKSGYPAEWVEEMLGRVAEGELAGPVFGFLLRLAPGALAEKLKKKAVLPEHPLFGLCEVFGSALGKLAGALVREFREEVGRGLPERCVAAGVLTHDMSVRLLAEAVSGGGGARVAGALARRYRAGLIDEFQDTDPAQAAIFSAIFAGGDRRLFYIGDPKQSIYRFRNADIRTYLAAAERAGRRYALSTCYRSVPGLLDGLNALFGAAENPFRLEGIRYLPVSAPERRADPPDRLLGAGAPLRFRSFPAYDKTKEIVREEIAARAGSDILWLTRQARWERAGRPVCAREIAVLVRTNDQARTVERQLRRIGLRVVRRGGESVFRSGEAADWLRVMRAVLEPSRERVVRTAFWGDLLGAELGRIAGGEEEAWRGAVEELARAREAWEGKGFLPMARGLLAGEGRRERMLRMPGGERMLTNYLHLAELLHRASAEGHLGPEGVVRHLRERMGEEGMTEEEAELRLESDGDAVLVTTVHKSKGLEYPVVLCPFLWDTPERPGRKEPSPFHLGERLAFDPLEREEGSARCVAEEEAEESVRLCYVAVTRAKSACWIYLADREKEGGDLGLSSLLPGEASLRARALALAEASGGSIGFSECDPGEEEASAPRDLGGSGALRARDFRGGIDGRGLATSFTAIVARGETGETPPAAADDARPVEPEAGVGGSGLFGFERGPRAGIFFHDLLERFPFESGGDPVPLAEERLARHGYGPEAAGAVAEMLGRLRGLDLFPGVRLGETAAADRLAEVAFLFPVEDLTPERLAGVLRREGAEYYGEGLLEALADLGFRPVRGYVEGVIDLLFRSGGRYYLADWKSNWLGDRFRDYEPEGLAAGMSAHRYHLQSLLYCAAADRFLAARVPGYRYGEHFGGAAYVFLRGIGEGTGVYRDRPPEGLVRAVCGL